jgi:Protein of unknown function (DUF2937)
MFGFVGRWLSDVVRLAVSLVFAIAAMQLPALTNDYTAALLQVTDDARHDLDEREQSARGYYHFDATSDEAVVAALKAKEPSNAESLQESLRRLRVLRAAYDRIVAAPELLRPPVALLDASDDQRGDKWTILRTAVRTHHVQIALGMDDAAYALAGLFFGSFVAQLLVSLAGAGRGAGATARWY